MATPPILAHGLPLLDTIEAATVQPPPIPEVLPGLAPGEIGVLAAPGGTGKTWLELALATAVATGNPFVGDPAWPTWPGGAPVLLVFGEDTPNRIRHRIWTLCETLRADPAGAPVLAAWTTPRIHAVLLSGSHPVLAAHDALPTPLVGDIAQTAKGLGARLVVFDPLVKFHQADENDNVQMEGVLDVFIGLARAADAAILLLHHVGKAALAGDEAASGQQAPRGATAIVDAARWVATARRPSPREAKRLGIPADQRLRHLILSCPKVNSSATPSDLLLRHGPGGPLAPARARGTPRNRTRTTSPDDVPLVDLDGGVEPPAWITGDTLEEVDFDAQPVG